jgi:hypothetical protein
MRLIQGLAIIRISATSHFGALSRLHFDKPIGVCQSLARQADDVRITARSRYGDLYGDASFTPPGFAFPDHV